MNHTIDQFPKLFTPEGRQALVAALKPFKISVTPEGFQDDNDNVPATDQKILDMLTHNATALNDAHKLIGNVEVTIGLLLGEYENTNLDNQNASLRPVFERFRDFRVKHNRELPEHIRVKEVHHAVD